ncbi:MAG: RNA polymerase sigma factor [Acidobacteriaceae bacterium]
MSQQAQYGGKTIANVADIRLVAEVLRKDRKATAEFVERFADCVYSYVRGRIMPRAGEVEDLVQEVFLAAWHDLEKFRGEADLQHWLLGIARHKIEDYYRRRLRQPEAPDWAEDALVEADFVPRYDEQLDRAVIQKKIHRILAKLPVLYGLVLLWRYTEQRSAQEMAQLTGKSGKAIERMLARARNQFRKEWNNDCL